MCLRQRPRPFSPGIVWPWTFVATTSSSRVRSFLQEPAGDDLALAAVVDVGGVEERDAALDGALDDRLGGGLVEHPRPLRRRAVAHHAEADARDAQTRAARDSRTPSGEPSNGESPDGSGTAMTDDADPRPYGRRAFLALLAGGASSFVWAPAASNFLSPLTSAFSQALGNILPGRRLAHLHDLRLDAGLRPEDVAARDRRARPQAGQHQLRRSCSRCRARTRCRRSTASPAGRSRTCAGPACASSTCSTLVEPAARGEGDPVLVGARSPTTTRSHSRRRCYPT